MPDKPIPEPIPPAPRLRDPPGVLRAALHLVRVMGSSSAGTGRPAPPVCASSASTCSSKVPPRLASAHCTSLSSLRRSGVEFMPAPSLEGCSASTSEGARSMIGPSGKVRRGRTSRYAQRRCSAIPLRSSFVSPRITPSQLDPTSRQCSSSNQPQGLSTLPPDAPVPVCCFKLIQPGCRSVTNVLPQEGIHEGVGGSRETLPSLRPRPADFRAPPRRRFPGRPTCLSPAPTRRLREKARP